MFESPTVTETLLTKLELRSDVNTITSVLSAFCLACFHASRREASTRRIASVFETLSVGLKEMYN